MSGKMNILMVGNICSTDIISDCINRLGHNCKILLTSNDIYHHRYDIKNTYNKYKKVDTIIRMINSSRIASDYDIIHWHSGVAKTRADFLLMKLFYKLPIVINYHGSESRMGYGMYYKTLANKKIVSTPDLLSIHNDAIWIPNPVPSYDWSFDLEKKPRVIHLPTLKKLKGTDMIQQVVDELKTEGTDFEYKVVEDVPHKQALEEISKSHIVIDQVSKDINYQLFGLVSLEAMSMGKVAVCHMDKQYKDFFPGCPIVTPEVSADGLKTVLRSLIETPEGCRQIGYKGREYVQRMHDPMMISRKFIKIYEEVLN